MEAARVDPVVSGICIFLLILLLIPLFSLAHYFCCDTEMEGGGGVGLGAHRSWSKTDAGLCLR